jgi:nucleotide-binding universal stress UspA family protein
MTHELQPEDSGTGKAAQAVFARIAACLDGSELSERVIPYAITIAQAVGAPVTFLRVIEALPPEQSPSDPVEWDFRRVEAADYLDELVRRCPPNVRVEAKLLEGSAAEQICLWADQHDVDLTVIASHGIGGATGWRVASTAHKLIERIPGSVLVLPVTPAVRTVPEHYQRVLVPLDGSVRAESVLPLAAELAAAAAAELLIAHVVPCPHLTQAGPLETADLDLRERIMHRNETVARAYLDRLRARWSAHGHVPRVILLRDDDVRSRLGRLIEDEDVHLVVLSSHGQSGRMNVSCGSVTADLLIHSSAPLLIVRPRVVHRASTQQAVDAASVRRATDAPRLPQQAVP